LLIYLIIFLFTKINFFILILYFGLFINIYCQISVWSFTKSSIDLLSSSESYNNIIYDETKDEFHVILKIYIEKKMVNEKKNK